MLKLKWSNQACQSSIYSKKIDHLEKVWAAFKRFNECEGQSNPDKCRIGEKEVVMHGHVLSLQGIKVDPSKIKALEALPYPNGGNICTKGALF